MIKLFELESEFKVTVRPSHLLLEPFKSIVKRDPDRFKKEALKELTYIYFMADYSSEYANLTERKKEAEIIRDVFGDSNKWKPDALVIEGVNKYLALQETASARRLKALKSKVDEITDFLTDLEVKEDNLKLINDTIKTAASAIESLESLEKKVTSEIEDLKKARGGGDLSDWERDS